MTTHLLRKKSGSAIAQVTRDSIRGTKMYKLFLLVALCAWFLMAAHEWNGGQQPVAQNDAPVTAPAPEN